MLAHAHLEAAGDDDIALLPGVGGDLDGPVLGLGIVAGAHVKRLGDALAERGREVVVDHAVRLLDALAVALAGDGVGAQAGAGALDDVGHIDAQRGGRAIQEREGQIVRAGFAGDVLLLAHAALRGHLGGGESNDLAQLVNTGRHGHDFQIEFLKLLHG